MIVNAPDLAVPLNEDNLRDALNGSIDAALKNKKSCDSALIISGVLLSIGVSAIATYSGAVSCQGYPLVVASTMLGSSIGFIASQCFTNTQEFLNLEYSIKTTLCNLIGTALGFTAGFLFQKTYDNTCQSFP